jgi:hypothetical protein
MEAFFEEQPTSVDLSSTFRQVPVRGVEFQG